MSNIEYIYTDPEGMSAHGVARNGDKQFSQFHFHPSGGRQAGLGDVQTYPYNLPAVIEAERKGERVFIVEGEKDADRLNGLGLTATTNHGGAGKWKAEYGKWLRSAEVCIVPDNDDAGLHHIDDIALKLKPFGCRIKSVYLPGLPKKGDVSDWLDQGNTVQDFIEVVEAANPWFPDGDPMKAVSFYLDELLACDFGEPKWAIEGLLPDGCTILAGPPKAGKTYWAMEVALAVAFDRPAFFNRQVSAGSVLFLHLEGTRKNIARRYRTMLQGANVPKNLRIEFDWPSGDEALAQLETYLENVPDTVLVVVDTIKMIKGRTSGSRNAYDVDYEAVRPFATLAEDFDVTVLLLHHTNKGDWDDPFDAISGSTGIRGAVDTEAVLLKQPDETRVLHAQGRDMERVELVFKQDKYSERYRLLGGADEVMGNQQRQLIFDTVSELGESVKPKDLFPVLQERGYRRSDSAMRHMLRTMVDDSGVALHGDGSIGYYVNTKESVVPGVTPSHRSQSSQDRPAAPGRAEDSCEVVKPVKGGDQ